jgi:hypothetical protein
MFGDFRFEPHLFVGYRITNGEDEGSFRSYLRSLLPRIEARISGWRSTRQPPRSW